MSENTSAKQLFNLLTVHNFEDLQGLDSATNKPPVNDQGKPDLNDADMFTFNWNAESGKDYGTVVILLNNDHGMDVFFGDNMGKTMEQEDKQEWFDFLLQLKQFATKNFLEFNPQNLNKLRYSLAGQAAIKEGLFESWKGNATTSWNDEPTQARLMVRHKKRIGEGDARYRYIESMFVETAEGERYRLPFTRLSGGRAMVEHVRQGGKPYDLRGQHIVGMVEELNVLSRFRRANLGKIFEGDTQGLVTEANAYYENLNRMMSSLSKSRGYETYFESWNPEEITQQDMVIEDIKTLFVEQNLDTRIEAALPLLALIQQGNAMKEANIFEAWVNNVMEGTWSTPDTPEKQNTLTSLLSAELPVGADATNATELLYNLIGDDTLFDQLHELADDDANADARQTVMDRLMELQNDPDVAKVLVGLGVDLSQSEVSDMDADAEVDKDLDEGSIRDGVWSADPPPAGGKNVPPPSPNEGPTSSTPAPRAPAPKAPAKKADSGDDMDMAVAEEVNEEYAAYDDTLAQILKHAGVNDQVTPAPDYETGVVENTSDRITTNKNMGPAPHDVLKRFPHEVRKFQETGELDDDLYHALYDWYNAQGMMPYGIAKDRDGDSQEWVHTQLGHEMGLEEAAQDYKPEMVPASVAVPGPVSDVIVDESTCNMTTEGEYCPEHGLEECGMYEGDYGLTLTPTAESRDFDMARLRKLAFGK